jgi:hypothetical protein
VRDESPPGEPSPRQLSVGTRAAAAPLESALAAAGPQVSDEASAFEALGLAPRLVPGSIENLKITWPADFELAERLLASRPAQPSAEARR